MSFAFGELNYIDLLRGSFIVSVGFNIILLSLYFACEELRSICVKLLERCREDGTVECCCPN